MNILEQIHSASYVVLMELVKHHLTDESLNFNSLSKVHLNILRYTSYYLDDDYGVSDEISSLYPVHALEATEIVLSRLLMKTSTEEFIGEAADKFRLGSNPIKYFTRKALEGVEDTPEYLRLRSVMRRDALPIILSGLDEMMVRGASEDKIFEALESAYLYIQGLIDTSNQVTLLGSDTKLLSKEMLRFSSCVDAAWKCGEIDGSIDTGMAKAGKLTGGVSGAIAGAKVGAVVGSVVPIFGTAVGVAVGSVAGNMVGKKLGEKAARPDFSSDSSVKVNDYLEDKINLTSSYAKETVEEAGEITTILSGKVSNSSLGKTYNSASSYAKETVEEAGEITTILSGKVSNSSLGKTYNSASSYAKESVEEAADICSSLSKKASSLFSGFKW